MIVSFSTIKPYTPTSIQNPPAKNTKKGQGKVSFGAVCNANLMPFNLYFHSLFAPKTNFKNKSNDTEKFLKEYQKKYPSTPLINTIKNVIKNPDCYINHGSKNVTFKIPEIDEYIIRMPKAVAKTLFNNQLKDLKPIKIEYPKLNIGQPIMQNEEKIQICKKQKGHPIDSCDWAAFKQNPQIINHIKAKRFLNELEELSKFPQESFDDLVKTTKQIDKHAIDYLNPLNFMVDKETKKIGLVDMVDFPVDKAFPCTKENIIYPLINVFVHSYFRDALKPNEQKQLDKATVEIIKKCNAACEKENIKSDKNYPYDFWKEKIIGYMGEEKYKELQADIHRTTKRYFKNN